jgi:hypothetical protein
LTPRPAVGEFVFELIAHHHDAGEIPMELRPHTGPERRRYCRALVTLLLSIIGYLLVNPVNLT